MKLLKKPYFYVAITVFLVGFLFYFRTNNPATKTIDRFIDTLKDSSQASSHDYIIPDLHNDPFLSILENQNIILDHKNLKTRKDNKKSLKINSSLTTISGTIDVWFYLTKVDGNWLISEFPKTTYIKAGVPLDIQENDKGMLEYQIDVEGTHLYCIFPSEDTSINIGTPISLILIGDYIVEYQHLIPMHLNRIVSASTKHIEDALIGNIPIEGSLNIYSIDQSIPVHLEDHILPMGISNVTLYRSSSHKNKNFIAYIDPSNISYNTIRVALNDTHFQSLIHSEIRLTSSQGLSIKNLVDNLQYDIEKEDEVVFKYGDKGESNLYHEGNLLESSLNRWYILPKEEGNIITNNIKRAEVSSISGTPYRGNMEIASNDQGLILINEVDLEEYLYSVVPSEMPVKFGLESLKVQAIAARAYAVRCFQTTGYAHLGAHVDDSTSSQVYNNIEENLTAIEAVNQTRGLVPVFEDQIVDARFFSTSCGYTSNFHEVWSVKDTFPSDEVPYLIAKPQFPGNVSSLYNEENFRSFMNTKDIEGYDRFSPFFRWNLHMKKEQLEAIIQKNLALLQQRQPLFVMTRSSDGSFNQQEIPEDLGQLQNISPFIRGQGGNIMGLEITTTNGVFRVSKELNIRQLITPINPIPGEDPIEIHRHDKSVVKDFPILPSSFFYIDLTRDGDGNLSKIVFNGGGYGHGSGMSQYGAYGLSLLGKSYTEIIEHYYPGAKLHNLY
ncbi:MAG TPA: SpoIID/LytB domain-containing protein [Clostridia bacterium]|nr:SpoIID/LytB domain-containing protein [Clostridia bacterium]